MGDSETVVAQSSAIQEHPSTTVNRDLAASTGTDTMDVDNVIPHEDDRASIQEHHPNIVLLLFIESAFDEHVRMGKTGRGNAWEMGFESFLDFVQALENKDTPEGITYLF
ncbi:hypothetical protein Lser_V15G19708 [Lactuca serriola]